MDDARRVGLDKIDARMPKTSRAGEAVMAGFGMSSVRANTMVAFVALVSFLAATPALAAPVGAGTAQYEAFLYCGLVVRGSITSVVTRREPVSSALPTMPAPKPDALVDVAEITLSISEVMKGDPEGTPLSFIAYVTASGFPNSYRVGQETVVGLIWDPRLLGGAYYMYADSGRLVLEHGRWVQQEGELVLDDLAGLRTLLASVAPQQVLKASDIAVVGTVDRVQVDQRRAADGNRYVQMTLLLSNVDALKGGPLGATIEVIAIASGDYWPAWRTDGTAPRSIQKGQRYCLFLRRVNGQLVLSYGINGTFAMEGSKLRPYFARRAISLGSEQIRAIADEGR